MRRRLPRIIAVAVLTLMAPRVARADDDPWFGKDKALHFAAGTMFAAAGYNFGVSVFDSRPLGFVTGGALAAAAGIGKELVDLTGAGDPSWRDLAWTGIGCVCGLALAWGNDALGRGVRLSARARGFDLRVTF